MASQEHPGQSFIEITQPLSLPQKASEFNKSWARSALQDHPGQICTEITWTPSPILFEFF